MTSELEGQSGQVQPNRPVTPPKRPAGSKPPSPQGQGKTGFSDVPTVPVGSMWEVPEGSVVSGPTGTHKTTGGLFCLQATGTYTNDTGDAITVVSNG